MVEEKVEAPKRVWIPRATLDHGGGSIYIGQAWDDNDTEYVRFDAERCQHLAERDALGQAIAEAAIRVGIVDGSVPLTGPQLVMLCHDLAAAANHAPNTRQRAERAARAWFNTNWVTYHG